MNDWLCEPFTWDDERIYDRGKVMTADDLDAGKTFGRYLDVDGDAIPYRTLPGTHPTKGAYFTRGTSRDRFAKYSEEGAVYQDNDAAAAAQIRDRQNPCARAGDQARPREDQLRRDLFRLDRAGHERGAWRRWRKRACIWTRMRLRAFPFADAVTDFINAHDQVFLVEQNRDAQMRMLLVNECGIDPARFISILHYDGTPITARFIIEAIAERMTMKSKEAAE